MRLRSYRRIVMTDVPPVPRLCSALFALALFAFPGRGSAQSRTDSVPLDPERSLALALDANPTLRAAFFDAVASRADATAAENARVPTLTMSSQGQYSESIGGTANGANRTRGWSVVSSAALSTTTEVGTVLSVTLGSTTQWRQAGLTPGVTTVVTIGPTYSGSATVSARQPLLRGRGRDAVLSDQRQAEARALAAEADADVATSQLVRDVLVAYWELWYADRAAIVQREAAALAAQQSSLATQRRSLGTLSPADALQFVTAEASLREQVASAEAARTTRAVTFARLLALDPSTARTIAIDGSEPTPVESPPLSLVVERLRTLSPQIRSLEADIEAAQAAAIGARATARPRLDATGSAGVAGLWMDDSYQGLSLPGGRPALVASVGLELELPIVADRARAQRDAAAAQLDAAEARLAAATAELEAGVVAKLATLESAAASATLTTETARVAGELAEAERRRLELGTSTPTVLLDAQQTARESRLRHDRALVDAQVASLQLDHDAGFLLDRFHASVSSGVAP